MYHTLIVVFPLKQFVPLLTERSSISYQECMFYSKIGQLVGAFQDNLGYHIYFTTDRQLTKTGTLVVYYSVH